MNKDDYIILKNRDGSLSDSMSISNFNLYKESILDLFLKKASLSEDQIYLSLSNNETIIKSGLSVKDSVSLLLADMEASNYIENFSSSDSVQYRLKLLFC